MLNGSAGTPLDGHDLMEEEEEVEDEEGEEFSEDNEQLLGVNGNNNQGDEDDDEEEEESSEMTASEDEASWISWFINMRGNDFFCEVEESFIQDDFNLTGLSSQVPFYDYALDMILDVDIPLGKMNLNSASLT